MGVSGILDSLISSMKEVKDSDSDPELRTTPNQDARVCIETLIKIHQNILDHPDEELPYRTLRLSNSIFFHRVWRHRQARRLLLTLGWIVQEDVPDKGHCIQLSTSADMTDVITGALRALQESLEAIGPDEEPESSPVTSQAKLKEEQDRKKFAEERKKALDEYNRQKVLDAEYARNIKREGSADQDARKIRQIIQEGGVIPPPPPDRRAVANPIFPGDVNNNGNEEEQNDSSDEENDQQDQVAVAQ